MEEAPEHNNIELIYEYTESRLKLSLDNINSLNTRLGLSIGFAVLLMRFGIEMEYPNLKLLLCLTALASIAASLLGIAGNESGQANTIDDLLDNFYYDTDERIRLRVVRTLKEGIRDLNNSAYFKKWCLNYAITFFAIAALLFASGVIYHS